MAVRMGSFLYVRAREDFEHRVERTTAWMWGRARHYRDICEMVILILKLIVNIFTFGCGSL